MAGPDLRHAKLRIARPTDHLTKIAEQYERGLGLSRLGHFDDHEGFDGVMLGHPQQSWHLEFTHHRGHPVGRALTQDHLLVFYIPDQASQAEAIERMLAAGFAAVTSYNPYWDTAGATFEDLDGYRVVLQQANWPP